MDIEDLSKNYMNILDRIKYFESDISANNVQQSDSNLKPKSIKTSSKNKNTGNIDQLIMKSNKNMEKEERHDNLSVAELKKQLLDKMKSAKHENISKIPARILSRDTSKRKNSFTSMSGYIIQVQDIIAKLSEKNISSEVKKVGSIKAIDYDRQQTATNKNTYNENNKVEVRFQNNKDVEMWRKQFHFVESIQAMDEIDDSEPNCNFEDFMKSISTENDNEENGENKIKSNNPNTIFTDSEELLSQDRNNDYFVNKLIHSLIRNNANNNEEFSAGRSDNETIEDEITSTHSLNESDIHDHSPSYNLVYDMLSNLNVEENSCEEIVEKINNAEDEIDCIIAENRFLENVLLPEQDYLAVLRNLLKLYEESKPHYHSETIRRTFGEIVALNELHKKFYKDLKRCRSIKELGQIFMSRKCSFDIYIRDKWEKSRHSLMTETIFVPHHNWAESQIIQYEYMLKQLCNYSNEETVKCAHRVVKELMQQCEEINWLNAIKNCVVLEIGGKFLSKEELAVSCGGIHFGISSVILMEEYIICVHLVSDKKYDCILITKHKTCFAYKPINAIGISKVERKKLIIEDIDNENNSRLILKSSKIDILQEWHNAIDYLAGRLKLRNK